MIIKLISFILECKNMVEPSSDSNLASQSAELNAQKLFSFSLKHDDFVHDVQFDYYGKRIATCSSDEKIKIWERTTDINFADVANANLSEAQKIQEEADSTLRKN